MRDCAIRRRAGATTAPANCRADGDPLADPIGVAWPGSPENHIKAALVVALALVPASPVPAESSSSHTNAFGRQTKAPKRSLFGVLGSKATCRDPGTAASRGF